ncbi:MAG: glutamine-synthetase adenylyltransferase, partial [Betaproteobacteria bacterium]|nr:glutamine-synthetase adenylyltransferase [Betaproteobacteria bacterium]
MDDWLATSPVAAWPSLTLPDHDALTQLIDTLCAQRPLGDALRIARQVVLCRLIECDVEAGADVDPVTGVMSDFAELAVQAAARDAVQAQAAQAGMPLRPDGRPAQLLVAGMGKLGAGELNVSSDIDLVMLHDVDGDVGALSHHEWFSRAARRVCQTLNATGDYGFVFRVDTRLRPNGDEGPSVCSLDMLEQYFSVQGRPWERFAWLRARLLGDVPADVVQDWQAVVLPFVYRRYMDFGMIEALR